jgi:hypothetical protein
MKNSNIFSNKRKTLIGMAVFMMASVCGVAQAQTAWPNKTIRIVVPSKSGPIRDLKTPSKGALPTDEAAPAAEADATEPA